MEIKPHLRIFEIQNNLLFGIAYRMLGSVSDSEDVLQETYLKWSGVRLSKIDSPEAYLTSITSRLCIDKLRKRKIEKLNYVGPWLPEPVPMEEDPELDLSRYESVNMAFLVMLERLNPLERAVFILREAFDISHQNIADRLQISVCYSRQLVRRAKQHVNMENIPATNVEAKPLVEAFFSALESGEMKELDQLLCGDVTAYTDGGGRVSAALIPLRGRQMVVQVFSHLARKSAEGLSATWANINGQWGLVFFNAETHAIHSVFSFELNAGKIAHIFVTRNPDKLNAFSGFIENAPEKYLKDAYRGKNQ